MKFSLIYQNVRGLRTKSDEFLASVMSNDYSMIAVTETWLSPEHPSASYFPENYVVYRSDREYDDRCSRGGGALIAVKGDLVCYRRSDLEVCPETVWIELCISGERNCLVSCSYFAPSVHPRVLETYLETLAEKIDFTRYRVLMVGDFNAPGYDWLDRSFDPKCNYYSKLRADCLIEFSDYLGLDQLNQRDRALDLFFTDYEEVKLSRSTTHLVSEDLYHPTLELIVYRMSCLKRKQNASYLHFPSGDYLGLYNQLYCHDWTGVLLQSSLGEAVEALNSAILTAMKDNIPMRKSRSPKYPGWYSAGLIELLKQKRLAHRAYKRSGKEEDYFRFACRRRDVKFEIGRCRDNYNGTVESELISKPQNFWKYVNRFRKETNQIAAVTVGDDIITDPQELCTGFGEYFSSVYQKFTKKQIRDDESSGSIAREHKGLPGAVDIPPVHTDIISATIKGLKSRTACGIDGIPAFIIKGISDIIAPILASLFNWSLYTGAVPSVWKTAVVTPIPKKGPNVLANHRPISVVGVVPKIFEKILCTYITRRVYHLISPHQHGFMERRSTTSNLCAFLSVAGPLVEKQGQMDVIYLDFQKAFDKLPHHLLLRKLPKFGFSPRLINWIESYLFQRTFRIRYGGALSGVFVAHSGVPQGSNLGPLFFLLFINDITSILKCNIQLFADDIKISLPIRGMEDHAALQTAIDSAAEWANENHMPLNHAKTVVVSYTRKTNPSFYSYRINGSRIQRKYRVSDLGVLFDSKLLFSFHVESIVSKARRNLGLVKWIARHFKNVESCLTLYRSLVRCHLEYATVVWNRDRGYTSNSIESVQRRFISWLIYRFPHLHEKNIIKDFKLSPLWERRTAADLIFFYRALHGNSALETDIALRIPGYNFRNSNIFTSTHMGMCDPLIRCVGIANQYHERLDFFVDFKTFNGQVKMVMCN